ncbi:MAG: glycosyltransferase family 4 protein [Muribaculaceae bacterium]|nr:glycosyltransferase family 4 protein [Muribaculaceae bacterium]
MPKSVKLLRATTVPTSLNSFCRGVLKELRQEGYDVVAVSSPGPELQEVEKREGCRTIAVPMQRHISPMSDLKSLWRMTWVMHRERPDIVHTMTPKAGLICMISAWLARVPVRIHTFTGLVWPTATGLKRRLLMFTDWITCACATHVVPEGEGVKADLLNHHITRKPIKVLGFGNVRGVDLDYWKPRATTHVDNEGRGHIFTFVFVGRIVADKGINELVSAFKQLNQEHRDTRLLLVGQREDDLDPVLPATVAEMQSNAAIQVVGPKDDVRPFYEMADALVFPSYREGFPNVVLEAGAMGLPSIVTDINGSREIIEEGVNGTIIPPRDAHALYMAMKRFLNETAWVHAMASRARPMVASRYEQGFVRRCLKDFYAQCIVEKITIEDC